MARARAAINGRPEHGEQLDDPMLLPVTILQTESVRRFSSD